MTQEREAFEAWYAARTQGDNRPWVGTRGEMFAAWQAGASLAQPASPLPPRIVALLQEAIECHWQGADGESLVEDARKALAAVKESLTAGTQPASVPAGWKLVQVSDGDIRVYGPDKESWLIRKDVGEGFYDFVWRFFDALIAAAPSAPQPEAQPHRGEFKALDPDIAKFISDNLWDLAAPSAQAEPAKCISTNPNAQRPHRPDDFCPEMACGILGQCRLAGQAEQGGTK